VSVTVAPLGSGAVQPVVAPVVQAIDVPFAPGAVTVPSPVPFTETFRSNVVGSKVAQTVFADVIDTVQVPVPEHAPDQPLKTELESVGVAASVTVAPFAGFALHPAVEPEEQVIGPPETVPDPAPARLTVSGYVLGSNLAHSVFSPFMVNVQLAVPEQITPHVAKIEPTLGEAARVTVAPFATVAVQPVAVQLSHVTPPTVPAPVPRNPSASG
jgi:hypothetical protein